MDTLMSTLTPAQARLEGKDKGYLNKGPDPRRPTILANHIEGAFNCVIHKRLNEIMTHYQFPQNLIATIDNFNMGHMIHM